MINGKCSQCWEPYNDCSCYKDREFFGEPDSVRFNRQQVEIEELKREIEILKKRKIKK